MEEDVPRHPTITQASTCESRSATIPHLDVFRHSTPDSIFPSPVTHRGQARMQLQQLDEGYSEDTRSQESVDGNSDGMLYTSAMGDGQGPILDSHLMAVLMALPVEQRKLTAESLVRTLPTAYKEVIGDLCSRLTKFDPVYTLPHELMLQVLSYLSPSALLICSSVSRSWRQRAQDEKLWRSCFAREGWLVDGDKMNAYEDHTRSIAERAQKNRRRHIQSHGDKSSQRAGGKLERKSSRKRKTEEAFSEGEGPRTMRKDESMEEPVASEWDGTTSLLSRSNDAMEDVQMNMTTRAQDAGTNGDRDERNGKDHIRRRSTDSSSSTSTYSQDVSESVQSSSLQIETTQFRPGTDDKLSWPWLYKQRCRLEKNWERGTYTPFQLPHRDHPNEGHSECVYTIQHTSKHLVSGSRDKTIRIWDLETQRLARKPLLGHEASVLCLQFDERPEHDLIVSGGSDAYVIIWRFSTGEILKKMTSAHDESVLNLRFDDRYIITCSKDKSIKVWNRRALSRSDALVPSHVLSLFDDPTSPSLFVSDGGQLLFREHSLLATLTGHHAAVNAVQIHGSTIVSASGDRTIKSWDIDTGRLQKTYLGHTKGIACVQFDGRRIVSGSSDNTVRIFDAARQAEIACLNSHSNLVRTVQARFGDLDTVTDAELELEAKRADDQMLQSMSHKSERGEASTSQRRGASPRRRSSAGQPPVHRSFGTKIPPGGGGTRWAKIVSGSYDELVKIWKPDPQNGQWRVVQVLHQGSLLHQNAQMHHQHRPRPPHATAPGLQGLHPAFNGAVTGSVPQPTGQPASAAAAQIPSLTNPSAALQHATVGQYIDLNRLSSIRTTTSSHTTGSTTTQHQAPSSNDLNTPSSSGVPLRSPNPGSSAGLSNSPALADVSSTASSSTVTTSQQPPGRNAPSLQSQQPSTLPPSSAQGSSFNPSTAPGSSIAAILAQQQHHLRQLNQQQLILQQQIQYHQQQAQQAQQSQQAQSQPAQPSTQQAQHPAPAATTAATATQAQAAAPPPAAQTPPAGVRQSPHHDSNRVFKLQFDARRIICCSQNKVIVGWDFAAGDKELENVGDWSVETA